MNAQDFFVNFSVLFLLEEDLAWVGLFIMYIGPETILPLTSFLAAIVGILLMFWRWIVGMFRKFFRLCSRTYARILGREWHDQEEEVETLSDIEEKKGE